MCGNPLVMILCEFNTPENPDKSQSTYRSQGCGFSEGKQIINEILPSENPKPRLKSWFTFIGFSWNWFNFCAKNHFIYLLFVRETYWWCLGGVGIGRAEMVVLYAWRFGLVWLTAGPAVVLAVVCLADFAGCGFWPSFNYLKYLYLFLFIPWTNHGNIEALFILGHA